MKSNVEWTSEGQSVRVLDESLNNYGFVEGQVVTVDSHAGGGTSIPVWTIDGALQARFVRDNGLGWRTAYTSFGYAGAIQYSVEPWRKIVHMGVLNTTEFWEGQCKKC